MLLSSTIATGVLLSLVQSAFGAPRGDGFLKRPRLVEQFPAQYSRGENWQASVDPAAGTGRNSASPAACGGEITSHAGKSLGSLVYNLDSEAGSSGTGSPSHDAILVLTVVFSVFGAFALVVAVAVSLACNQQRQLHRNGIQLQDLPRPTQSPVQQQPEMSGSSSTLTLVPRAYIPGRRLDVLA